MLTIRFQRIGRKNDPAFRIVVTEKTASPKAGKYVDLVGTYNPKTKAFKAEEGRIKDWISKGAQVSPSLKNLFITKGILEGKKLNVLPKKSPILKEVPATEPAGAAEAAQDEDPSEETAPASEEKAEEPAPAA